MTRLPKSLDREPLIDAVFEVRLGGNPHIADLLPGVLFAQINPKPKVSRLPPAEIPQPIRASDPNLIFAPVVRLDDQDVTISFGDRNIVIGCKMPYPKWPQFKARILTIINSVAKFDIAGPVERYSLKYVNLIQAQTISEQIAKINIAVTVGDIDVKADHLSVQVHRKEEDTLHILQVVTGANVLLPDGNNLFGSVLDVDSIRLVNFANIKAFAAQLEPAIETLRLANKRKFFSCLNEKTIDEMGPRYD